MRSRKREPPEVTAGNSAMSLRQEVASMEGTVRGFVLPCEEVRTACGRLPRQSGIWATLSWELASGSGAQRMSIIPFVCWSKRLAKPGLASAVIPVLHQCHCLYSSKDRSRSQGQEPMTYMEM